ncbi:hypothetical protein E1091_01490 [Micromonospora fluostatini]|uniref:Terminase small subunit n=1 Tax=Micromonospora fluostatini TaxID=1629071 RepID=A0ABY2DLJ5_9ACTN|nr:hypothetical protein E1091_01490 [Micromonospora fluostatini]
MAFTGPEPKSVRLGRGLSAEWTDVPDVPYAGPSPDLPELDLPWFPEVTSWWELVRRMPHCVLWSAMDWQFALHTAFMWQDWWKNFYSDRTVFANKSTEIRRREDQMGTTAEARRKLRIRYVDPEPAAETGTSTTVDGGASDKKASVTSIASRRGRLAG